MTTSGTRRAIGRLIIGKVPGTILDDHSARLLEAGTMGGVTFFKDNAQNLRQLSDLVFDIVTAYSKNAEEMPVVAVDQEGGAVQRFDQVITPLPSPMALAATNSLKALRSATNISATELKLLGFNCLLSPVLDIALNPKNPIIATRAFSDNAILIESMGRVVADCLTSEGILAVGKHFPGHGGTKEDSHVVLPLNEQEPDQLWKGEIAPFRNCLTSLPAVLTSHVWFSKIDQSPLPASLSSKITTGILREHLKFDRLIMTDDLLMKAIINEWGLEEAAVLAIEAGADLILACGTSDEIQSVNDALVKAVESGRIREERIDESLTRIERACLKLSKERYLQIRSGKKNDSLSKLEESIARNHQTCLETSLSAICQLRGDLPDLTQASWVVVAPDHPRYKLPLFTFLEQLKVKFGNSSDFSELRYSLNPDEAELARLADQVKDKKVIYLTYRTLLNPGQINLGDALICSERIAIAVDVPYDASCIAWQNYLATFDPSDLAMEALAILLLKKMKPTGRCPVNINVLAAC